MKTMLDRITLGIFVLVMVTGVGVVRGVGPEPMIGLAAHAEDRSTWVVPDEEQAVARAQTILGVPAGGGLRADADTVLLAEDNTPFLSGELIGRPVWHVVISGWKLKLKSARPEAEDSFGRTFDVFLRAEDGRFLKIVSRWPEGVPPVPPEPGPASYTDQMRRAGNEKYYAFPEGEPPISMLEALECVAKTGRHPLRAEQIVGQYVVWSRMGRPAKPVWVITLRGTQAMWESHFQEGSGDAVAEGRNHFRHIVDPQEKKWFCASSTPQPFTLEGKPLKRITKDESPN